MNTFSKRLMLLALLAPLSLQLVGQPDDKATPFRKAVASLEEMIKTAAPTPQKAALDKVEKEIQSHCLKAAMATKDFGALALLAKLKGKLTSIVPLFIEPAKQFVEQIKHNGILGTIDKECTSTQFTQKAVAPAAVATSGKVNKLCQHLFKKSLTDALLELVYTTCGLTEAQLTSDERTELNNLAHVASTLAEENIAKTLSNKDLDDLNTFCSSALFNKLRSTMPSFIQTVINTFPMDAQAKKRICGLFAKVSA